MSADSTEKHRQRRQLALDVRALFQRYESDGDVTGAVIAEIFAQWLSNHNPMIREQARAQLNDTIDELIVIFDEMRAKPWPKAN